MEILALKFKFKKNELNVCNPQPNLIISSFNTFSKTLNTEQMCLLCLTILMLQLSTTTSAFSILIAGYHHIHVIIHHYYYTATFYGKF